MNKVSVVFNTLNEEANIAFAIDSIKKFADEIIVVDMESIDDTVSIAKKLGAKVYSHKKTNYVEPARNFAISKATGDWILILDADESIDSSLIKELQKIMEENKYDYIRLPRKNMIFGKWMQHSGWWPDYNIRFFKRGKVTWNEIIHSVPLTVGKGFDLEVKEDLSIIHNNYISIDQYLEKLNRYTTIQSKDLHKKGVSFEWKNLITKPTQEFLRRFFAEKGYKDGIHGLSLSLLQAFSELILYLKLWQLNKFNEQKVSSLSMISEIRNSVSDINYWISNYILEEHKKLNPLELIRRKLRI